MQGAMGRIVCAIKKANHSTNCEFSIEEWLAIIIFGEEQKREGVNLISICHLLALLVKHAATYSTQMHNGVQIHLVLWLVLYLIWWLVSPFFRVLDQIHMESLDIPSNFLRAPCCPEHYTTHDVIDELTKLSVDIDGCLLRPLVQRTLQDFCSNLLHGFVDTLRVDHLLILLANLMNVVHVPPEQ